jgi:hypothetical protein
LKGQPVQLKRFPGDIRSGYGTFTIPNAVTAVKQENNVKMFLMGEVVECEGLTHQKFNVDKQLKIFVKSGF